ncbi:hypothetical protein MMC25_005303 [Agyrium rufum]|nr:hypothetical protein [Agyrium rufum]
MLTFYVGFSASQTLLFNGMQAGLFTDASTACLQAFNSSLACATTVQLLGFDLEYLSWSQTDLASLCTSACSYSLSTLASAVSSACGSYEVDFNGGEMTAVQVIDLFRYKYQMSCLSDTATNQFCLVEERTWNITQLNMTGQATWPLYTNKTYPNWIENDDGSPLLDYDGTIIADPFDDPPQFQYFPYPLDPTGIDYYTIGTNPDFSNYGWPLPLEYDEYPLQYRACDNLFLNYAYCVSSNDAIISSLASASSSAHLTTTTISTKSSSTTPMTTSKATTSTAKSSTTAKPSTTAKLSTTTTIKASSTSSYVPAPTQTVTGTTSHCYQWYTTQSGDGCYAIEQTYSITSAQFRSWNTYIDAACDNLFLGYAYCVKSPDPITVTS